VNEHRNLLLALLLSAIVLFGWTFVSNRYFPPASPPSSKIVDGKTKALPQPNADPAADTAQAIRDRALVLRETPRVAIETPSLRGSINLKGARIDDLVLNRHKETIAKNSPSVRLLSPAGSQDAYFSGFGWFGEGVALPGAETVWTASAPRLAPGTPVTLGWDNGQGQLFEILLTVDQNYMFGIEQRVTNRGSAPVVVQPYALVSRVGVSKDPDGWTMHTGPIGVLQGSTRFVNYGELDEEGKRSYSTTGGWLGFGDKYWLTAVIPARDKGSQATFQAGANHVYQADFVASPATVGLGQAQSYRSQFFAGAKEVDLLNQYRAAGVPLFNYAIDWGWFWFFEQPIFRVLDWLFRYFGNFGFAIMGLTLIMRLAMFPIAQKQFKSMAAMRSLQPKMKALQERYKDDKVQQQQELMKLYKDEKVSPLAGCLPVVIQIPIWYALYKVLLLTIEMRHQPFVGWIHDLSAPDPMTPVNLFGYLPFTPPHFLAIGVLPIMVAITMYLQFKLNPQAPDPVQQQVFSVMPWILMFVMASFAAGLQLYWVTSNLLTVAQQKWLYSRYPALKAAQQKT
jgi:YidC/Oxa1 family membrane protein insertase